MEFIGRRLTLSNIRGRITDVAGFVTIGSDPADSSVFVTLGMASVTSGNEDRDRHLRSAELLDAAIYPTATFRSTTVHWYGSSATVIGELTIAGTARPAILDVKYLGATRDPSGQKRAVFSATTEIDREIWKLNWNRPLETGGLLVSTRIRIEIEAETTLDR